MQLLGGRRSTGAGTERTAAGVLFGQGTGRFGSRRGNAKRRGGGRRRASRFELPLTSPFTQSLCIAAGRGTRSAARALDVLQFRGEQIRFRIQNVDFLHSRFALFTQIRRDHAVTAEERDTVGRAGTQTVKPAQIALFALRFVENAVAAVRRLALLRGR